MTTQKGMIQPQNKLNELKEDHRFVNLTKWQKVTSFGSQSKNEICKVNKEQIFSCLGNKTRPLRHLFVHLALNP